MSPRRRVLLSALVPGVLFIVAFAAPVHAQFYDAARGSLGFTLDAIERSPRLVGMGQLTLVGDDPHTRLTLWDFAANPVGILSADSTSTMEFYPGTSSYSGVQRALAGMSDLQRQNLAGRESRFCGEIWRRVGNRMAYGLTGSFNQMRRDEATDLMIERRTALGQPTAMGVLVGHLPFVKSPRWLYSARLYYSGESSAADYYEPILNPQGAYIDQSGTALDPPDLFTPTDYRVRTTGGGFGVGYDRGSALRVAVTADQDQNVIKGSNNAARHMSQTQEARSYTREQISAVGRLAPGLEWGVDGRNWNSQSQDEWYFSISAGTGGVPVNERGRLLEREESGQALRARLRWVVGPVELGGGLTTFYRKIAITPPRSDDPTSFNHFLNVLSLKSAADSLMLPDSVEALTSEQRSWEAGGGMSVRLFRNRGLWGAEYHLSQGLFEQTSSGEGPLAKSWDVRSGFEYRWTPVLTGRAGYRYRWSDQDDYIAQNEYYGHTMTLGLGLRPAQASWTVELGYAVEWLRADYGSAAEPRASRQQLASMLRWVF